MDEVMGALLPFHRRMVQELIDNDGLCVMASGMSDALSCWLPTSTARKWLQQALEGGLSQ